MEMIRFHCSSCQKRLKATIDQHGMRVKCTRCNTPLTVPNNNNKSEDTNLLKDGIAEVNLESKVNDQIQADDKVQQQVSSFAEIFSKELTGKQDFLRRKEFLDKKYEAVEYAYQPSGKIPFLAFPIMLIGIFVGPILYLASKFILSFIFMFVLNFVSLVFMKMFGNNENGVGVAIFLTFLALLFGLLVLCLVCGVIVAGVFVALARYVKCRNPVFVCICCGVSVLLGLSVNLLLVSYMTEQIDLDTKILSKENQIMLAYLEAIICAIVSLGFACYVLYTTLFKGAFCEQCNMYMSYSERHISATSLAILLHFIKSSNIPMIIDALKKSSFGSIGKQEIYVCKSCSDGFVNLYIECKFCWLAKNEVKEKNLNRLVESCHIRSSDLLSLCKKNT